MGHEPHIPIESKITTARDRADPGHGAPGQYASTNRVVRGPGRRSRLMGVVAVVGLLAGGLLWWAGDDEGDDDGGDEPSCGIAVARERGAHIALFESVNRLETVTSGPKVWTRNGSTLEGLSSEPWAFRTSARLSLPETAASAHLVLLARDPAAEVPDTAGRCVIRATSAADMQASHAYLPAGADLLVTLDEDGDIARIVVMRSGEPQAIALPDRGVRPVEPGRPWVPQP